MAALQTCGLLFRAMPVAAWTNAMHHSNGDWADRIGERISTIFIAALALMFAYGYLGHFFFG